MKKVIRLIFLSVLGAILFQNSLAQYDFNSIRTENTFSAYGGTITQRVYFKTTTASLSGMGLDLVFGAGSASGATAFTFNYNGNFVANSISCPVFTSSSIWFDALTGIGSKTQPKRLKIFGTGSSGTNGSDDAALTLWQSANVVMHLDGNDIWSEDNLYLNDYSDKNVFICPKANSVGQLGVGYGSAMAGYRLAVNGNSYLNGSATINNLLRIDGTGNFSMNGSGTFAIDGNGISGGRMIVNTDGSVGINCTNTHGFMLAVNGAMICTKIVARPYSNWPTWPDYVFNKDYKLQSLPEVERYIATHGHLQDMPTAQEVQQQGVDVGEMNRLLLQKVEELTLQLIQLNKTVEQLKKDVKK